MTNAEKYLKDNVSELELRENLSNFIFDELGWYEGTKETINEVIADFFVEQAKPTLTEDERAILRHLKGFYYIYRANTGELEATNKEHTVCGYELYFDDDVFQFIKERRRI